MSLRGKAPKGNNMGCSETKPYDINTIKKKKALKGWQDQIHEVKIRSHLSGLQPLTSRSDFISQGFAVLRPVLIPITLSVLSS
jgi:hypothetical protein